MKSGLVVTLRLPVYRVCGAPMCMGHAQRLTRVSIVCALRRAGAHLNRRDTEAAQRMRMSPEIQIG
jgi:hypothetical protein